MMACKSIAFGPRKGQSGANSDLPPPTEVTGAPVRGKKLCALDVTHTAPAITYFFDKVL